MLKWIRRMIIWALSVMLLTAGGVAAIYYSGAAIPLFHDLTPVTISNWNRTAMVEAEIDHDSRLVRRGNRINILLDLQVPEAARRLQAFLDGGRTEVVACGPQKLFMHSLTDGEVSIDGELIRVRGTVNMELDGPVKLRDDWPLSSAVRIGHDRTTVWANVISLSVANVPEPMIEALLRRRSRFTYTREQVVDLVAKSMVPEDAAILVAHRDALDMAFESVRPALRGDALVLDAVVSVDERAALRALGDRVTMAAGERATALAGLLGPSGAHAQLNVDDFRRRLEGAGKQILKDAASGKGREEILRDPKTALEPILRGLTACEASF